MNANHVRQAWRLKHGAAKMESQRLTTITDSTVSAKLILKQRSVLKLLLWNFLLCLNQKNLKNRCQKTCLARIHTADNLSIDIFSSISAEQIQSLIGAVTNVK